MKDEYQQDTLRVMDDPDTLVNVVSGPMKQLQRSSPPPAESHESRSGSAEIPYRLGTPPPTSSANGTGKKSRAQLKINPVGDRILVQHTEEKEQIRKGVIIPDNAREKSQQVKVIALGAGNKSKDGKLEPFEVKVGDTVLVGKFSGCEVLFEEQRFTLLREEDILGVIA